MTVTRADTASLGYCNAGVREYFAAHGLNWRVFIQHGLPVAAFDKVKTDPMIVPLLAAAERRGG